jgi:hypothetical protein
MIGGALMALGVRHLGDILPLAREPIDAERFGLFAKLVMSFAAIMAVPDEKRTEPGSSPSPTTL